MGRLIKFFKRGSGPEPVSEQPLLERLAPFRRPAWFPVTRPGPAPTHASKFSGIPLLPAGTPWPACPCCNETMQLLVQIDSASLPPEAPRPFGEGHLQVFYCTNADPACESDCEAFFPFSCSSLVRVIAPGTTTVTPAASPVRAPFPEQVISYWTVRDDYPTWEELEEQDCVLSGDEVDALCDQGYPLAGDKLGGWPAWVQGVEYPDCPDCGRRMELVLQIDSEDHLPYMFGDAGCAHVTRCPNHPQRMTIAWACC